MWREELCALVHAETTGVPRDVRDALDELARQQAAGPLTRQRALDAVRRAVPYRGLQVFSSEDAVRFYGRDRAVDEILRVLAEHSVVLVGSSGSGKSSVVRAGCLPALAQQGVESLVFSPGENPLRTLATVWCQRFDADSGVLEAQLRGHPTAHLGLVPDSVPRVVVVVDQLEECFTLCADPDERAAFLGALAQSAPRVRLLAILRGDFYGRASEHPEFAELLQIATVVLPPITRDELRTVIEAPAAAART